MRHRAIRVSCPTGTGALCQCGALTVTMYAQCLLLLPLVKVAKNVLAIFCKTV